MEFANDLLAVLSGAAVGFSLGLIGGGGSILATPLLLYVVGITEPHVAIGTGALAVSVSAYLNFLSHARTGHVRWGCAAIFAGVGALGAYLGSSLGKAFDGDKLLFGFGLVMVIVALAMLRPRIEQNENTGEGRLGAAARLGGVAAPVGIAAGFFGIGGGFLIVPGLILATGMPIISAIGTSLFAVGSFGLTTAANYAVSDLVNWPVAAKFIGGGVLGGLLGIKLAVYLCRYRHALNMVFAGVVLTVAAYMLWQSGQAIWA
jgi:uncharacterized membrane protein YfcA